jgi:hypothetical protein
MRDGGLRGVRGNQDRRGRRGSRPGRSGWSARPPASRIVTPRARRRTAAAVTVGSEVPAPSCCDMTCSQEDQKDVPDANPFVACVRVGRRVARGRRAYGPQWHVSIPGFLCWCAGAAGTAPRPGSLYVKQAGTRSPALRYAEDAAARSRQGPITRSPVPHSSRVARQRSGSRCGRYCADET